MEQKRRIITQEIMNSQDSALYLNTSKSCQVVAFDQYCSGQMEFSLYNDNTNRTMSIQNSQQNDMSLSGMTSSINAQSASSPSDSYPSQYENSLSVHSFTSASEKRKLLKKKSKASALGKRKRQQNRIRKSEDQIQELIIEFRVNPEWSKEKVTDLSEKTGLSESQVYKWNWDQRKKFNADIFESMEAEVTRDEFGGYCCKKWGKLDEFEHDDNICTLLGLDVNKMALELVKGDLEKRQKLVKGIPAVVLKQSPLLRKKEVDMVQKLCTPLLLQTPQAVSKKLQRELISVQQCKEQEDNQQKFECHQLTTPKASYSRTTADSNQSWLASINKSPQALFEPQPFSMAMCSPWKYDSCHFNGPLPGSTFQLRIPGIAGQQQHLQQANNIIVNRSPIKQFKSPSKVFQCSQNTWGNLFSPSPMREEKENNQSQLYETTGQFRHLDFNINLYD
eukprot:403361133